MFKSENAEIIFFTPTITRLKLTGSKMIEGIETQTAYFHSRDNRSWKITFIVSQLSILFLFVNQWKSIF